MSNLNKDRSKCNIHAGYQRLTMERNVKCSLINVNIDDMWKLKSSTKIN